MIGPARLVLQSGGASATPHDSNVLLISFLTATVLTNEMRFPRKSPPGPLVTGAGGSLEGHAANPPPARRPPLVSAAPLGGRTSAATTSSSQQRKVGRWRRPRAISRCGGCAGSHWLSGGRRGVVVRQQGLPHRQCAWGQRAAGTPPRYAQRSVVYHAVCGMRCVGKRAGLCGWGALADRASCNTLRCEPSPLPLPNPSVPRFAVAHCP
jgi:hypothetical protein